ncbi:DNA-binding protein [Asaia lannensis]
MAWADGDAAAFAHALSVIARAQGADDIAKEALSGKGDLDLTGLFRVMSAFGIKVAFHTTG